ncbi:MAG TPA: hypothetical protein VN519_06100 [Bryobacteraceae bacterium]|nr:hypothetical protein [Bryobacteraceae bacterium]
MTQHFDLKQLSDIHGLCLTIIEPLRTDPLPDSDPGARILRVAKAAATLLEERGYDEASRREYLQPILKIARNIRWTQHRGSFAIFRAPGFTVSGFWPETLEPEARLADEFFILPLLCPPVPSFWLLALSINHVRLFHGDRHMLSEVQLGRSVPDNLRDAGAFDTPDRDLENRSACGGSTGNMHAVRFGTGSENERRNRHLHDFFKQIDRAIHPHVSHDGEQLILAGVARERAMYREVNSYPHLNAKAIEGSPDATPGLKLHAQALDIMLTYMAENTGGLSQQIDSAAARGLLLSSPASILEAARDGKIENLFIDPAALKSGSVEADLINSAAVAVIHNSGTATCAGGLVQEPRIAAATLRYRVEVREPEVVASAGG